MKFKLEINIKPLSKDLLIVISQFIIIILHFIKLNFFNQRLIKEDIFILDYISNFFICFGILVILISLKDLGKSLSAMPRPKKESKLIKKGIYKIISHPMYYSLILISLGFFIKTLTFYNLVLTILISIIVSIKINLEEEYLKNKYIDYKSYRKKLKI